MSEKRLIDARLAAAGVAPGTTPVDAWRRLREAEGHRATVIDLYELIARDRGLAAHQLPLAERVSLARWSCRTCGPAGRRRRVANVPVT